MATLTSSFTGSTAIDLAAAAAHGVSSATSALSLATAAYDRAEIQAFAGFSTRTSTLVAGSYANGDSATLAGSNLLANASYPVVAAPAVIHRLDYRFSGGESVRLTGDWSRSFVDWPFLGNVDRADVTVFGGTVSFTGIRLPPNVAVGGTWGFDGVPVVGAGRLGSVAFSQGETVLLLGGTLQGTTQSLQGVLESTIVGTVNTIQLTSGTMAMTLTGVNLAYADVVVARDSLSAVLAQALSGNDVVTGTKASEMLEGWDGDDTIDGGAGFDTLVGGAGNDLLVGGADSDILIGGAGDDVYVLDRPTDAVAEDPDGGVDLVRLAFTASASDTLASNVENGTIVGAAGVTVTLFGNSLANVLAGSAQADRLEGGGGADTLQGAAGNDTLSGGAGDDLLQGGTGADTYAFGIGGGHDVVRENDATAGTVDTVVIAAGSGNLAGGVRMARGAADGSDLVLTIVSGDAGEIEDTLTIAGFFDRDALSAGGAIEQLRFSDGDFTLSTAQILAQLVKAGAADDAIRGYAGNDLIDGLQGDDLIRGVAGHDTLVGNLGDDQLDGGAGSDLLRAGAGRDTLEGGDGNDLLEGGSEADDLRGGAGADFLLGGDGDDVLAGGAGMDTLVGGAGDDTLTGGAQADRFVLNSLDGRDEITDFAPGLDRIAIHRAVFTAVTASAGTPTDLAGLGGAFAYDGATGALSYDADGAGGADPVVIATLSPDLALARDFLVIG